MRLILQNFRFKSLYRLTNFIDTCGGHHVCNQFRSQDIINPRIFCLVNLHSIADGTLDKRKITLSKAARISGPPGISTLIDHSTVLRLAKGFPKKHLILEIPRVHICPPINKFLSETNKIRICNISHSNQIVNLASNP